MGDDLLERRAVKQCNRQDVKQVEPAAGLADVLHNEVGRCVGLEPLLVLERVVELRKRHGTGVEPDIQDIRDAAHHGLTGRVVRVRANQLVNLRAVQCGRANAEVRLQLIEGSVDVDTRVLVVIGDPHRNRRTPVAGTGDVPVACALEPLAELTVANVLRHPFDLVVVELHHAVADLGNGHEPAWQCHVD